MTRNVKNRKQLTNVLCDIRVGEFGLNVIYSDDKEISILYTNKYMCVYIKYKVILYICLYKLSKLSYLSLLAIWPGLDIRKVTYKKLLWWVLLIGIFKLLKIYYNNNKLRTKSTEKIKYRVRCQTLNLVIHWICFKISKEPFRIQRTNTRT